MLVKYTSIEQLTYALINEIGFSIDGENYLYDQDTFQPIACGNKRVRCSISPDNPVFASEFCVVFEPLNFKFMTMVLSIYLQKEEALGSFKVLSYNFQDNGKRGPENLSNIRIKFVGNTTIESKYYYNRALKICDIILRIGGQDPDLSALDVI